MLQSRGFAGWFDRLISRAYAGSQETIYKARILAGIVSLYIILLFVTCCYILFFAPMSSANISVSLSLLVGLIVGYSCVLYLLVQGANYQHCASIVIFATFAGVVAGVATSGGPLESPATPIMVVPIVLAFSLGTKYSGLTWSAIVLLAHLTMIAIDRWLFKFPQMLDMSSALTHHMMHWLVTYFAIIFLMLIFESINQQLKRERDAERDRYAYLATHDPLTGLANRSMFDSQLLRALASSERHNSVVGLMVIDLDGFKPVNDTLGHDVGDKVLIAIAHRLNQLLRKTDTVARIGGDEFAIILENVASPAAVNIIAQRVIDEISRPYDMLPASMTLGASLGIAMYPDHTRNEENLRIFADRAMYAAKKRHNCYQIYREDLDSVAE